MTDHELRLAALDRALSFSDSWGGIPSGELVRTAELFYAFLKGAENVVAKYPVNPDTGHIVPKQHGDPDIKLPLVRMIEGYGLSNYEAVLLANEILDAWRLEAVTQRHRHIVDVGKADRRTHVLCELEITWAEPATSDAPWCKRCMELDG